MNAFRTLLVVMIIWIIGITGVVAYRHGLNLVPIFFGDIVSLTWPGQFNADFICFLVLSSLWVAWRNQFSSVGLILLPIAAFFGISFLAPYLLILSYLENGDMKTILMGRGRANC
jgi:hypothetical protein